MNKAMGLKLPNKMTPELAEFLGILIGDGSVYQYTDNRNMIRRIIEIVGHSINDREHFKCAIIPLFKRLFNINVALFQRRDQNVVFVRCQSKGLYNFLKDIGIKTGPKIGIGIPNIVLTDKKFTIPFVRGLIDTDGCVCLKGKCRYPVLSIKQKNKAIIQQLENILKNYGFRVSVCYNNYTDDGTGKYHIGHSLFLHGEKGLSKWVNMIGFSNPKHSNKLMGRVGF